jgi:hypothetical protein
VGLLYGGSHFPRLHIGNTGNLGALLTDRLSVADPKIIAFTIAGTEVSWGLLLKSFVAVCTAACAVAMAVHDRRGNGRFLLATVAFWAVFVAFSPQMHERYPLYPALISATLLALGPQWILAALVLQAASATCVLLSMFAAGDPSRLLVAEMGPTFGQKLQANLQATMPGAGWAVVTLAIVLLAGAMNLRRDSEHNRGSGIPESAK